MKVICTQENLAKGLNITSHIAGKNITLPILNNILIKIEQGKFSLISTNLDIGIKTLVRGKVEETGEITVPARLFSEYIALVSAGNIALTKKDNNLIISAGEQQTVIKGQEADEYPIVPDIEGVEYFSLESKEFKEILGQVIFCASYDDVRPELSGVLFLSQDDKLVFVATDSYRLAEKVISLGKENEKVGQIKKIVPLMVLQEILRVLNDDQAKVEIGFNENQIIFKFDETIVISRLIEGNYPDYKEIIPGEHRTRAMVDRNNLIKIIRTASLFSKKGINDILLDFNSQERKLEVSAANIQLGENKATIGIESEGENNSVVFNYKYLLDGLQNMPSKKIIFEISSSDSPVILKAEGVKDYLYLIMPIRK
ncbi:DNA polymerase III subunit beta [Candidatus Kuenenbacteria bacterium RIFCSPHIGHO2_02_FULL_39_13]|uniref:Beta sliding clamp n=1 Tax=Candidatus Kuenenbacteria bacterium RIFCSPHIGHO2_02_FULL_39_13 TaxID=1798561 RepID=A0A1F6FNZ1_9BACT|nr:MAG: DNA polymerase III subunit beta [Candidatus Kuenenbacteria bacterium RIFCSPHIGHO2_02_FULL_39_13]